MKITSQHLLIAGASALALSVGAAKADQVILDDLIVDGSICAGLDCVNGESFGFDTLRLKENNLRIKAQDTSNSASFPTRDWQITFNDSSNGGQNKFSIDDIDGARTPFTIEAGARTNALYVDDGGRIGAGTATPAARIHAKDGNTPTLRLEQDGTSGFQAQTFDVAANEANFFVRDATNGSTLPFRIEPGAATNSLVIDANNDIGMGTNAPKADLHVLGGGSPFVADASTMALFQNSAAAGDVTRFTLLSGNTGNGQIAFGDTDSEFAGRIRYFHSDNHMDFLVNGSVEALRVFDGSGPNTLETATSTAVLTSAGVWQNASSRTLKQNIKSLDLSAAKAALTELEPVTYQYKKEPDELVAGFVAEDVPEIVATSSRKTLSALDITAVLTRVVQDQQETIEGQQAMIAGLTTRIEALEQ